MRTKMGPLVVPAVLLALAASACESPPAPSAPPADVDVAAVEIAPEPAVSAVTNPEPDSAPVAAAPATLWPVEGYVELHALAARAKLQKRRLLLGLSGGAT